MSGASGEAVPALVRSGLSPGGAQPKVLLAFSADFTEVVAGGGEVPDDGGMQVARLALELACLPVVLRTLLVEKVLHDRPVPPEKIRSGQVPAAIDLETDIGLRVADHLARRLESPARYNVIHRLLEFHAADIGRIFPGFDLARVEDPLVVFILRDLRPVGLVICRRSGPEDLVVELDYVIPSHRDFRCAHYFYRAWSRVMDPAGVRRFSAHTGVPRHRAYLKRLGFAPDPRRGPHGPGRGRNRSGLRD